MKPRIKADKIDNKIKNNKSGLELSWKTIERNELAIKNIISERNSWKIKE